MMRTRFFYAHLFNAPHYAERKKRIILKAWRRHGNDEKKRNLFEELVQGIEEINQHLEGKITLKYTDSLTAPP